MPAQLLASDRRTARQPEQTLGPLGIPARELRPRRPKIDRGGARSRALRTMRDFCPRNEPVRPSRPTEAKTLTQRQRGGRYWTRKSPLGGHYCKRICRFGPQRGGGEPDGGPMPKMRQSRFFGG